MQFGRGKTGRATDPRRDMNKRSSARFSSYFSQRADIDRRLDVLDVARRTVRRN